MRKLFKRFLVVSLLCAAFFSCKKEGEQLTLNQNPEFPSGLTASESDLVLTTSSDNDTVLTFNWPATAYGAEVVTTYSLQLDLPADTTGATPWGSAKTFLVGNNMLTYGFTGKVLNNLLSSMGLAPDVSNPVVFRVVSVVNQANNSASTVPNVYSSTLTVNITSYPLTLYVPGAYQGWNPGTAPELNPVPGTGQAGKYDGYYYITGGGTQYFKYTNARDWNHTNYGDSSIDGLLSVDGNAGGLYVNGDGYYELTADFNTMAWTGVKTVWGIVGDATPGGWDNSTPMTYDPDTQVWTVTAVMKKAGSYKFRANNNWAINFGINADGKLEYADNPLLGVNPHPGLNNLTVAEDGTYLITLDLHISGVYNFSLVKQ